MPPTSGVLVTGGAGFIGSHLSRRLIDEGYRVTIIDDLSTGSQGNIPAEAEFVDLDLTRESLVPQLPAGPYVAVCHLAGQASGEKSFEDPLYDLSANARATLLLSHWALERGIPTFLHASSMGVYGQVRSYPVKESVTPQPISYYGASKYCAEQLLGLASKQGLRRVSFRMFSVYGPGQDLGNMKQGMVSIYLSYLLKGQALAVKGSLDRVRDFVYIDDVVDAWMLALERPVSGVFNLGSGKGTSVRELIASLLEACGLDQSYSVHQLEETPGDQWALAADIGAIQQALGWKPKVSLREGLDRMVAWSRVLQEAPR